MSVASWTVPKTLSKAPRRRKNRVSTEQTRRTFLKTSAMGLTVAATGGLGSAGAAVGSGSVEVRVTSGKLRYSAAPPLEWRPSPATGENVITVDPAQQFQEMLGFGAAFTDASCY